MMRLSSGLRTDLRRARDEFIIGASILGGHAMCHERLWRRLYEERAPGHALWDDFERTRPLTDPEPEDNEAEILLDRPATEPVAADH